MIVGCEELVNRAALNVSHTQDAICILYRRNLSSGTALPSLSDTGHLCPHIHIKHSRMYSIHVHIQAVVPVIMRVVASGLLVLCSVHARVSTFFSGLSVHTAPAPTALGSVGYTKNDGHVQLALVTVEG